MPNLLPLRYCLISLALLLAQPSFANRIALVIGNAAYEGQKPLRNPGNDAQDVASKLSAMQFNSGQVRPLTNLKRKGINDAVRDFVNQAAGAELAMVYYSGHGMQAAGETYLIPTDAQITSEYDEASEGLPLSRIMGELQAKGVRRTLIVLDACRDNPYSTGKKGGPRGLAPPREMSSAYLVAYATADGKTADDGKGRNGTYTAELLRFLDQPGKNLRDVMEDTQLAVEESSKGAQVPKIYGDTAKFRDVFLRPGRPAASPPVQVASLRVEPEPPAPVPPRPLSSSPGVSTALDLGCNASFDTYINSLPSFNGRLIRNIVVAIQTDSAQLLSEARSGKVVPSVYVPAYQKQILDYQNSENTALENHKRLSNSGLNAAMCDPQDGTQASAWAASRLGVAFATWALNTVQCVSGQQTPKPIPAFCPY